MSERVSAMYKKTSERVNKLNQNFCNHVRPGFLLTGIEISKENLSVMKVSRLISL